MGALVFLVLFLFMLGVIYPVAAIAYLKLYCYSKRSIKAILADL